MVGFSKTISEPEIRSGYLNLTGDNGSRNRHYFPGKNEPLWILFSGPNRQRYYTASMVESQIWGSFKQFIAGENIKEGDLLHIQFDGEFRTGRHLVHVSREIEDYEIPETIEGEGEGYVYAIRNKSAWPGWVKIGETERLPEEREEDYQTYSPNRDYFLDPNHSPIFVPYRKEAEKRAHRMASRLANRIGEGDSSEWFMITDERLSSIFETLKNMYQ